MNDQQEQADLNMWVVFGGKDQHDKRQDEIKESIFND